MAELVLILLIKVKITVIISFLQKFPQLFMRGMSIPDSTHSIIYELRSYFNTRGSL